MSTILSTTQLLTIPLAPLFAAIVVGIFGTKMGGNLLGRKVCQSLAILGVALAFVLSLDTLLAVLDGARYNQTIYEWMILGSFKMEVGFLIDSLSAMMMCVVTFVSLMVHIYTIGYMQDDPGFNRFFSYIALFTFAMLMLVMSNNTLQLFFGWEAVGLVSYLLIGFWFERPSAVFANLKAFLVNRVGDFGFILGIGLLVAATGSFAYQDIFAKADDLAGATIPVLHWDLISVACICLFIGAMGKSAQFPLHVWLPDSMEGPTPISALIHAATMVTAGIFMVARFSPLFELSDMALNLIVVVGSITALFMGLLGLVQNDIKRVVAYSTLSQLGYMTVALGVSAYSAAVFHLMTHAFFKALLFLGAGSVIIGMHHNQDMRHMGGLWKYMKVTWITALLGSLALCGIPFFSGFYSKDSIIEIAHVSQIWAAPLGYWALLAGVFVTALYTFRMFFMVFHGKERFHDMAHHDSHSDSHNDSHNAAHTSHAHTPHESPGVVWLPLVLLAIPSVVIGYFTIEPLLFGDFFADSIHIDAQAHSAMREFASHFHGPLAMALHAFETLIFWLVAAAIALAFLLYIVFPRVPAVLAYLFAWPITVLKNKYYMDWVNENILARLTRCLGVGFWKIGDEILIDGVVVNGSWKMVGRLAQLVRSWQSGFIYQYALVMIVGVLALMTYFVWFN